MSRVFLDASALVKRYLTETGSTWIRNLTNLNTGNTTVVAEITLVEVSAAIAARHRAPNGITKSERDATVNLLARHFTTDYQLVPVARFILDRAVLLTQAYCLRGYDAIQLAAGLAANQSLLRAGLPALTFIAADHDLLAAANQEGLQVENPNDHLD